MDTQDTDHPVHEIRWGERANKEVKKSSILRLVCNLFDVQPSAFKEQLEQASSVDMVF